MSDPIDLAAQRNKRAAPDAEHVRKDDFGRSMYRFLLEYEMDGSEWSAQVWAYDFDDAQKRVASMRASLRLLGQAHAALPA